MINCTVDDKWAADEKLVVDENRRSNFRSLVHHFNLSTAHILLKNDPNEALFVALYSKKLRVCLETSPSVQMHSFGVQLYCQVESVYHTIEEGYTFYDAIQ